MVTCHLCGGHKEPYPGETRCIDCRRKAQREGMRRRYWKDPEKAREKDRAQKARNPDTQWFRVHPDRARASCRRWRAKNPGKVSEYNRRYASKHTEVSRETVRRRRALLKTGTLPRDLPRDYVQQLLDFQGGRCAYCHDLLCGVYQVDHVIPISKGGLHEWSNVVLACPGCNRTKGAQLDWSA